MAPSVVHGPCLLGSKVSLLRNFPQVRTVASHVMEQGQGKLANRPHDVSASGGCSNSPGPFR